MHDIILMITGAGAMLVGFIGGRVHRPKRALKPPKPVCGCRHSLGLHDEGTGECHGTTPGDYYKNGKWLANRRPCTCRRYDGPQPLPEFFAPEISS